MVWVIAGLTLVVSVRSLLMLFIPGGGSVSDLESNVLSALGS